MSKQTPQGQIRQMAVEHQPDNPTRIKIELENESPSSAFITRSRCCFHFPCLSPATPSSTSPSPSLWDRIRSGDSSNRWWGRPIRALKKLREWSEIVAGPKWKTFIRRFNRRHHHRPLATKFQYDPLSYALNFDDGGQSNGQVEEDFGQFRDFSSRFAALPVYGEKSMDLGKA